ncbi:MAG: aminopeptidase P family protein, partial [Tannerella sp.]|nr:aminopeptidase P family protein [Tannerella sp.]
KLSFEDAEYFANENIKVMKYDEAETFLAILCNMWVGVDPTKVSFNIYDLLKSRNAISDLKPSPVDMLKSVKNDVETAGFRNASLRDGVAMVRFLKWFETEHQTEHQTDTVITEYDISLKIKDIRSCGDNFVSESFATIAACAANGALNHYIPTASNCKPIPYDGFLLLDSGGQYLDGTTDITRTIALGTLTDDMKRDYTLVLKGLINLSQAVFPSGTRGSQIDAFARRAMWEHGINYLHGTGHGVGSYLNVHEGPQSIRQEENPVGLRCGMVVTNEPGIYHTGDYGVRIENMMLIINNMTTEYGDFLAFETLTLCPIDTTPIISEMMTQDEISWLNDYHSTVYSQLSPYLNDDECRWLKIKTSII